MWYNWQTHVPVTIKTLPSFLQYYQVFIFMFLVILFHPRLFDITTTYIIIVSSLYMSIKTNHIMFEISFFLVACTWLCVCITMHHWMKKKKNEKKKMWLLSEIWKFCFLLTATQNVWNSKTCSTYFILSNIWVEDSLHIVYV